MTTKRERRAVEVYELKAHAVEAATAIVTLVEALPVEAHLGTHRAIRNSVARCLTEVSGYVERETARREARDDRA